MEMKKILLFLLLISIFSCKKYTEEIDITLNPLANTKWSYTYNLCSDETIYEQILEFKESNLIVTYHSYLDSSYYLNKIFFYEDISSREYFINDTILDVNRGLMKYKILIYKDSIILTNTKYLKYE